MNVECRKCEIIYDDEIYYQCPKCQEEDAFESGLQLSRRNKKQRG